MSDRPGFAFHTWARQVLGVHFNVVFEPGERSLPVHHNISGQHPFDLATADLSHVGECKDYTWRASGGIPNGKIEAARRDVSLLQEVSSGTVRFIAFRRASRPGYEETLAQYFVRTNRPSLGSVQVLELDPVHGVRTLHP